MYKTETHIHVSEISPCSKINAVDMMKKYHDAGYKTVFISDHFKQVFFDELGDIPWEDKVTIFLSGYYKAKTAGEKLGMNVLMSAEILFSDSLNHYLVYGITAEFLKWHPDFAKLTAREFYDIAKENDIFVVQAHPFRGEVCFPTPDCADAFEVYNSNPRHTDYSEKSVECAKENGLYVTAGSDAHKDEDIGLSGILSENEIKTAEDFIELIKSGNATFIKG